MTPRTYGYRTWRGVLLAACKGLLAQVGFKARVAGDEGHFTEAAAFARAQIAKATTEGTR